MGRAEKEKVVTAAMDRDNSGVFDKVDVADDKNKSEHRTLDENGRRCDGK